MDYGTRFTHNGFTVTMADGVITVVDPNGWHPSHPDGLIVATFEYGDDWITDTETGNSRVTSDPMAVVFGLVDNLDVTGIQTMTDDGWNQCSVCDTLGDFEMFCSTDCASQAQETED